MKKRNAVRTLGIRLPFTNFRDSSSLASSIYISNWLTKLLGLNRANTRSCIHQCGAACTYSHLFSLYIYIVYIRRLWSGRGARLRMIQHRGHGRPLQAGPVPISTWWISCWGLRLLACVLFSLVLSLFPPLCPGIDWQQQKVRRRVDRRGQAIRSLPSARSPCWLVLAVMHRLEDEVMRAALPTAAAADRSAMNNATGECRRSSVTPLILPSADNGSNGRNGARFAALASGLHSQKEEQFSPNKKSLNHATPYIS